MYSFFYNFFSILITYLIFICISRRTHDVSFDILFVFLARACPLPENVLMESLAIPSKQKSTENRRIISSCLNYYLYTYRPAKNLFTKN